MDFEVIDIEEVEEETVLDKSMPVETDGKVWCEFCKGYYFPEYHFGDQDD